MKQYIVQIVMVETMQKSAKISAIESCPSLDDTKPINLNGYTRRRSIPQITLKGLKLGWLLEDSLSMRDWVY